MGSWSAPRPWEQREAQLSLGPSHSPHWHPYPALQGPELTLVCCSLALSPPPPITLGIPSWFHVVDPQTCTVGWGTQPIPGWEVGGGGVSMEDLQGMGWSLQSTATSRWFCRGRDISFYP